jgi:4-amino-4-deoxy-L-arabinose transferase-like glycosyltransferase
LPGINNHSLWRPDEIRVAEVGREMLVSGDYVVPRFLGETFIEKPPLFWWAMVGGYKLLGVSDGVARLPGSLASLLLLLVVFDLARRIAGPRAGVLAALVHATTCGFLDKSLVCRVDSFLALFVSIGYWGFVVATFSKSKPGDDGRPPGYVNSIGVLAVYAGAGLAFLSKGPVGPILIAAPIGVWMLCSRRWYFLRSWAHLPGVVFFVACCVAWPIALYVRGGQELLGDYLLQNILYRIVDTDTKIYHGGHKNDFFYLFESTPDVTLPWLMAYPAALLWWFRGRRARDAQLHGAAGFVALIVPLGVLLLSFPATKRGLYLLPLLAGQSAFLGVWFYSLAEAGRANRLERVTQGIFVTLLGMIPVFLAGFLILCQVKSPFKEDAAERWQAVFGGIALVPWTLLVLVLAGTAVLGLKYYRARSPRWIDVVLPVFVLVAVLQTIFVYPLRDPDQNFRAFPEYLVREGVSDHPLIGFRLDGSILESVAFYTGKFVDFHEEPESLAQAIRSQERPYVLVSEGAVEEIPPALRTELREIGKWDYSDRIRGGVYILFETAGLIGDSR